MALPDYADDEIDLRPMASWPASRHLFDERQRQALRAAEAAGRPLLVRGDPGTGKSQLAHAAAQASGRLFLPFVIDSRTEAADLMWRYDAVARLADAHLAGVPGSGVPTGVGARQYIHPGPLWWAFNWGGATRQAAQLRSPAYPPHVPDGWDLTKGCVLLIDEIDKAEAEVPNGLLEALGNGSFSVPLADEVVQRPDSMPAPLVVITTNDERELPAAFLRRCMVLTLALPTGDAELERFMFKRGKLHFGEWAAQNYDVLQQAAKDLVKDRAQAKAAGIYMPGLAEYLDLLRALREVGGDPMQQLAMLEQFTYRKQPAD